MKWKNIADSLIELLKKKKEVASFYVARFDLSKNIKHGEFDRDTDVFLKNFLGKQLWVEGLALRRKASDQDLSFVVPLFTDTTEKYSFHFLASEKINGKEGVRTKIDVAERTISIAFTGKPVAISLLNPTISGLREIEKFEKLRSLKFENSLGKIDKSFSEKISSITNNIYKRITKQCPEMFMEKKTLKNVLHVAVSFNYPTIEHPNKAFSIFVYPSYELDLKEKTEVTSGGLVVFWNPEYIQRRSSEEHAFLEENKDLDIGAIKNKAYFMSSLMTAEDLLSNSKGHATKSAIAAIMSRNMSHNIGSHVLSKVSIKDPDETKWKEWGKDMQILSQYLQQRQDFIAQIATEWPEWTYPAWLMKDLVRWFLSQKHLLNYIASSENLEAHFYKDGHHGKPDIRFHVFKSCKKIWDKKVWSYNSDNSGADRWKVAIEKICQDDNCGTDCNLKNNKKCSSGDDVIKHTLLYTGKKPEDVCCCLDEDIQLAVLGGIAGYHAFYTILENVIRNGAKHSFTKMKKLWEGYKDKNSIPDNIKERLKIAFGEDMCDVHMDVIVEFFDEAENGSPTDTPCYRFRVYDNVSFVTEKEQDIKGSEDNLLLPKEFKDNDEGKKKGLNPLIQEDYDELKKIIDKLKKDESSIEQIKKGALEKWELNAIENDSKTILKIFFNHLIIQMNNYFRQDIITETGELKKENWGLAEMRISAGYLQGRDISHIGMGKDRITDDSKHLSSKLYEKDKGFIIRATVSPLGTLAYEFRIPKPKEVGIVCKE